MVMDFNLAILWNNYDALARFGKKYLEMQVLEKKKKLLKHDFHAGFRAVVNSVVYQNDRQ